MLYFLFVYDVQNRTYPIIYIISDAPVSEVDMGAGTYKGVITKEESEELIETLREKWHEPEYRVARMSGTSWKFVAENYPGLSR